jgi:hypothetical protein
MDFFVVVVVKLFLLPPIISYSPLFLFTSKEAGLLMKAEMADKKLYE